MRQLGTMLLVEGLDKKRFKSLFQLLSHAVTPNDFMVKIDRELFENYTVEQIIEEEKDNGRNTYMLIS